MMTNIRTHILLLLASCCSLLAAADDTWQYILREHGYDAATVHDLTAEQKIKLAEPRCAYVNITGTWFMPTLKTQNTQAWLEFYDGEGNYFKKRVVLNAQGNSSIRMAKKNVSVRFYEEDWGEGATTDISFGNWMKQDVFHLKAYYTDYLRGCGKVAYDIYDDITSDREQPLPWQRAGVTTASAKAMCHPNGFPCYVYVGGWFYGIYTWQLKKSRKNMGLEKDNPQHIYIDGTLSDETLFRGTIDWSMFEVRTPDSLYCTELVGNTPVCKLYDGDNPRELIDSTMTFYDPTNKGHVLSNRVKQSLLQLSGYYAELKALDAMNPTAEAFKRKFSECFDTQGLTDYIVHSLVTNNYDGHQKNWQWCSYDGTKWYVQPYDLDCTFGHHASGLIVMPPEWNFHYGTHFYEFAMGPSLQNLFLKYYLDEVRDRYIALREKQLIDAKRYVGYLEEWQERIGPLGFELEYTQWYDSPCCIETIASPNWTTEDNWENFNDYPAFSSEETYHAGDKCTLRYRIWTATDTSEEDRPYKQLGGKEDDKRAGEWIAERIALLDNYFHFDPDHIQDVTANSPSARKTLLGRHLYIIKDGRTYSVDGKASPYPSPKGKASPHPSPAGESVLP